MLFQLLNWNAVNLEMTSLPVPTSKVNGFKKTHISLFLRYRGDEDHEMQLKDRKWTSS